MWQQTVLSTPMFFGIIGVGFVVVVVVMIVKGEF
jgi:hypothetical protein